jgi:hypothetical protein
MGELAEKATARQNEPATAKEGSVASLRLDDAQGDGRTNGISDRESNSQPNCENHQDIGHALATNP